jgi:hypothetical protein
VSGKQCLNSFIISMYIDGMSMESPLSDIVYLTLRGLSIDIPSMYIEIIKLFRHCLPDTKRTLHRHSINVHRDNKAVLSLCTLMECLWRVLLVSGKQCLNSFIISMYIDGMSMESPLSVR